MSPYSQLYANWVAVTPNDNAPLPHAGALYVTGTGTLKIDTAGGQIGVTLTVVPANALLPVVAAKVYATGTSATGIFLLY
jgi:hypothetical protein